MENNVENNEIIETTNQTEGTEMTEQTEQAKVSAEDIERMEALRDNVINFFVGQLKRADKSPVKQAILKEAVEKLNGITLTEEEMNEILSSDVKGSKTVKWTATKLKHANVATYVVEELQDKIEEMNESMAKRTYVKMLDKFKALKLKPAIMPCPMPNCQTNEFVKTNENEDGTWTCACTNPKHIKISVDSSTEFNAINEWNAQVS